MFNPKKQIYRFIKADKAREGGMAMILALIAFALGSLMIVPTLNYMVTGLQSAVIQERRTGELYAADAGIEDAIWKMKNESLSYPYSYQLSDINGSSVNVTIENYSDQDYRVTSVASATTIEAYASPNFLYFPGDQDFEKNTILDDNVYVDGDMTVGQSSEIYGDIYVDGDLHLDQAHTIIGIIYATGTITMDQASGGTVITGVIYAGVNLIINQGITIHGDLYAGNNIDISKEVNIIDDGNVSAGGAISWNPDKSFIEGEVTEGYSGPWPDPPSWLDEYHKLVSYQIN